MKHLKLFENYVKELEFYTLYDDLVYIDDIDNFGQQIEVKYITKNNVTRTYIADSWKEIDEDFIPSKDSFDLNFKNNNEAETIEPIVKIPSKKKIATYYDIVYYIGNKKVETLKYNVAAKNAYSLKGYFSKNPIYKKGTIKMNPIK